MRSVMICLSTSRWSGRYFEFIRPRSSLLNFSLPCHLTLKLERSIQPNRKARTQWYINVVLQSQRSVEVCLLLTQLTSWSSRHIARATDNVVNISYVSQNKWIIIYGVVCLYKANSRLVSQEIPHLLLGPEVHCLVHENRPVARAVSQMDSRCTLTSCSFKICFNIILPLTYISF